MIAFDADVLTDILRGDRELTQRAAQFPPQEQAVPIILAAATFVRTKIMSGTTNHKRA